MILQQNSKKFYRYFCPDVMYAIPKKKFARCKMSTKIIGFIGEIVFWQPIQNLHISMTVTPIR